jgi:U3 small nucleolar RNA-associated protein 7
MIALDPEFVGSLAPPSKLTTTSLDGKPAIEVPFARLPRLQRLRVQGKADETEAADDVEENVDGDINSDGRRKDMAEREKMKKRGKGKSLKRYASQSILLYTCVDPHFRYLRKQRKNVIDPTVVCVLHRFLILDLNSFTLPKVAIRAKLAKQRAEKQRAKSFEASTGHGEARRPSALDRFKRKA